MSCSNCLRNCFKTIYHETKHVKFNFLIKYYLSIGCTITVASIFYVRIRLVCRMHLRVVNSSFLKNVGSAFHNEGDILGGRFDFIK